MDDKTILKEIGVRIKLARKASKMTQEQLAEKMDVSIQMISNLELGKKAIRPENIVKVCDSLNVSADYVLRGQLFNYEKSETIKKYKQLTVENQILINNLIEALVSNS